MNNVKAVTKLNETELKLGLKTSWHDQYNNSAYVFIGGLDYGLTEGDLLAIFSQYGEIVNINLVRDKKSGQSKGFCFLGYENQRSTVLAVDNFNGIKVCGRTLRVDHVREYRRPKDNDGNEIVEKGCAPVTPTPSPSPEPVTPPTPPTAPATKKKKKKKDKKAKKDKTKRKIRKHLPESEDDDAPPEPHSSPAVLSPHRHKSDRWRKHRSPSPPSDEEDEGLILPKRRPDSNSDGEARLRHAEGKLAWDSGERRRKGRAQSPGEGEQRWRGTDPHGPRDRRERRWEGRDTHPELLRRETRDRSPVIREKRRQGDRDRSPRGHDRRERGYDHSPEERRRDVSPRDRRHKF